MSYKISVPQPCQEDWNLMTQESNGRHCEACKTVVTDFTTMSDAEIIKHLKATAEKTCGRFTENQLNRELIAPQNNRRWFGFAKFSAAASILLSLLQIPAMAQNKKGEKVEQTQILKNDSLKIDSLQNDRTIKSLQIKNVNTITPIYQGTLDTSQIKGSQQIGARSIIMGRDINSLIIENSKQAHQTFWQRFKRKIRRLF